MKYEWHLNGKQTSSGEVAAAWKVGDIVSSGIRNYRIDSVAAPRPDGVVVFGVKVAQALR